jgi:hypothetical protein
MSMDKIFYSSSLSMLCIGFTNLNQLLLTFDKLHTEPVELSDFKEIDETTMKRVKSKTRYVLYNNKTHG